MTEESTCPKCGEPISGVASVGPDEHRALPCGHRLSPGHEAIGDSEDG